MSPKEQRRSPRKEVTLNASVSQCSLGTDKPVRTVNLSKRGALIEADEEILLDDVCTFRIVTNDARVIDIQGRVAWVKQNTNVYQAGISFRNLSVDEDYLLDLVMIRSAKK